VVTVGARNLATLRDFYRAHGWPQAEDLDDYAAFALRGAVFAVFPATSWPTMLRPSRPDLSAACGSQFP
jgi:hypothetical protein